MREIWKDFYCDRRWMLSAKESGLDHGTEKTPKVVQDSRKEIDHLSTKSN